MASRALSLQEISDRIEIDDLLTRYAVALDTRNWELLDTCFTADAHVDYTSTGGVKGPYPEVRRWLEKALAPFAISVHYIGNKTVTLRGDEATARSYLLNPMGLPKDDGSLHLFTIGGYYDDRLVRTESGWRIARRVEEKAFVQGALPEPKR